MNKLVQFQEGIQDEGIGGKDLAAHLFGSLSMGCANPLDEWLALALALVWDRLWGRPDECDR